MNAVIGTVGLFLCTSTPKIEAEIAYPLVRDVTDDVDEWVGPISFEEHLGKLDRTRKKVQRNRLHARLGLGLIIVGFALQLVASWI